MTLKDELADQIPGWRERVKKLVKESGNVKVDEGIRFRGLTIPEVLEQLPKPPGAKIPYVGGLYYLLLIGKVPSVEQALEVENEWKARASLPRFVFDVLNTMPRESHPMMLFSSAILALQSESVFARQYHEGLFRSEYWEAMLEDSLNLTAKLPAIAAIIYCLT